MPSQTQLPQTNVVAEEYHNSQHNANNDSKGSANNNEDKFQEDLDQSVFQQL